MASSVRVRCRNRLTVSLRRWLTRRTRVIDRDGNAFSTTPSDGSSGTPIIPGTGLHRHRADRSRGPIRASCRARAWQTAEAYAESRDDAERRKAPPPFGSPGNDIQPCAMLQVFLNVVVWGMEPQEVVEAPRFATYSFPASSEPHAHHPGRLSIETGIDGATRDGLARLGHKVAPYLEFDWRAGAVAIRVNRDNGLMEGAADPRRPAVTRWGVVAHLPFFGAHQHAFLARAAHQHRRLLAESIGIAKRLDRLLVVNDGKGARPVGAPQAALEAPRVEHALERIPDVRVGIGSFRACRRRLP